MVFKHPKCRRMNLRRSKKEKLTLNQIRPLNMTIDFRMLRDKDRYKILPQERDRISLVLVYYYFLVYEVCL